MLRPCPIGGDGLAVCNFRKKLSMHILCLILRNPKIKNLKYSKENGITGFNLNGSRIILHTSGYTQIHGIKNKEDTKTLVVELEKIIKNAFIH